MNKFEESKVHRLNTGIVIARSTNNVPRSQWWPKKMNPKLLRHFCVAITSWRISLLPASRSTLVATWYGHIFDDAENKFQRPSGGSDKRKKSAWFSSMTRDSTTANAYFYIDTERGQQHAIALNENHTLIQVRNHHNTSRHADHRSTRAAWHAYKCAFALNQIETSSGLLVSLFVVTGVCMYAACICMCRTCDMWNTSCGTYRTPYSETPETACCC